MDRFGDQSDSSEIIEHAVLLSRVSTELNRLFVEANSMQDTLGDLTALLELDAETTRRMQGLDLLSQVLEDLSKLTRFLSMQDYAVGHEVASVAERIQLYDVVDRLTGTSLKQSDGSKLPGHLTLF